MKYLPEPQYFNVNPGSHSSNYTACITPYNHLDWTKIVAQYGIQVPEIIDMTQGKSHCKDCKAVYVGYQPSCTAKATFHRSGAWNDQRGYHYAYPSFEKTCEGRLVWEFQDKFSIQKKFFELLERLGQLPDLQYEPLNQFRDHFPAGVPDALKVRLMSQDIEKLSVELPQIKNAIKTIAEKMNSAGNSLSFGF